MFRLSQRPLAAHKCNVVKVHIRNQREALGTLNFKNYRQYHNDSKFKASSNRFSGLGIGLIIGAGIIARPTIWNDVRPIHSDKHILRPIQSADTYENGLYQASRNEELELFNDYRKSKVSKGNWLFRLFFRIKFAVDDYILDPIITLTRIIELSAIFLPVLISAPICFFGKKQKKSGNTSFKANSTSSKENSTQSPSDPSSTTISTPSSQSSSHVPVKSGALLWYRYLRWSLEAAGASFIKLGQWAASRTDIFSKEMCEELSCLHSNAKAHSLQATKKIVSDSFGMPFDEIFDEFNESPAGVGAIAQVYIAKLSKKALDQAKGQNSIENLNLDLSIPGDEEGKSSTAPGEHQQFLDKLIVTEQHGESLTSNQQVAIKVLHPNVEVKINRDLKIMKLFADFINIIPTMEWLSLPDEVEQFSILMRLQLDLRIEGLNLAKFRYNFKNRLDIYFPKPFMNFTSRDVLVEQYIHAIPMSKLLSLKENYGRNLSKEVSDKILDSFLKMLILDNFIHADLHPGNMMVRFYKNEMFKHEKEYKIVKSSNEEETNRITSELLSLDKDDHESWYNKLSQLYQEGYHAEICFLDVGLITELNHVDRFNFIDLFRALSEFDGYKAGELMVERSRTPETVINKEIFALKVEKLVDRMKQRTFTLGNISIGDLLDQVLGMVRGHHVRMEGDFITVIVAILLLEGIGRQLDPDLDLFARFVYAFLFGFPTENDIGVFFV